MSGTVISYPIPAYSNPVIQPLFYAPSRFEISNITLGKTTIITTLDDMNYVIGQLIRLIIPATFGCIELNQRTGYVISIPSTNQVEVDINSIGGNAYIASMASNRAQILAIGDINSGVTNASGRSSTGTFIPGSFIDISPNT